MQLILLILVKITYCLSDNLKDNWYRTLFKNDANDWIELRSDPASIHSIPLSTTPLAFAARTLKFQFPFYEEKLDNLLSVHEGFLYMDTRPQVWGQPLAHTRYIAPLMAGFNPTDPGYTPQDIRYYSNDTIYINQWSDMSLGYQRGVGSFTFQVQLHCDGVIKFIYKKVPIPISGINDTSHIVKIGISDAYSEEDGVHTFIPFDVIDLDTSLIASDTTYVLTPTPTCGSMKYCGACVNHSPDCVWCPALHRCSTAGGMDQYYKLWLQHSCPSTANRECSDPITPNADRESPHCNYTNSYTPSSTPHLKPNIPIIPIPNSTTEDKTMTEPPENFTEEQSGGGSTSSTTIIITISITAVCIAAILVISALLILKLRAGFHPPHPQATRFKMNGQKVDYEGGGWGPLCKTSLTGSPRFTSLLDHHHQSNGDLDTMLGHHHQSNGDLDTMVGELLDDQHSGV